MLSPELEDLRARLQRASETLGQESNRYRSLERARLIAKKSGVDLALDYLRYYDSNHESDQSRYESECELCDTDAGAHLVDCPNNPRNWEIKWVGRVPLPVPPPAGQLCVPTPAPQQPASA